MIYEIYYEPKGGVWRLRITTIYLFFIAWSSIASQWVKEEGPTRRLEPLDFDTYEDVAQYVKERGIDKAYRQRKRSSEYNTWVQAEGCHA